MNPSARSKRWLESHGYIVGSTERCIPQARRRIDLYRFIDLLAMPDHNTHGQVQRLVGIQATSLTNVAGHCKKLSAEPNLLLWLRHGNLCEIHGWGLGGKRGARKTYRLRRLRAVVMGGEVTWIPPDDEPEVKA